MCLGFIQAILQCTGAIVEQFNELDAENIEYEQFPGVSSVFASAAALKTELTLPTIAQTVILTRDAGRTPVPEKESLDKLASHQATMAIFLSIQNIDKVISKLVKGGYSPETPVAVVYRASWPDEKIFRGKLSNIAEQIKSNNIRSQGMIIVGDVLKKKGELSGLYHSAFAHAFREADQTAELPEYLKTAEINNALEDKNVTVKKYAVYSLTENGLNLSMRIAQGLNDCDIFASDKFQSDQHALPVVYFSSTDFSNTVAKAWNKYSAHIFITATGIAVRTIAPLLNSKLTDPAVICGDDMENYLISLTSGHIGGANRIVREIAKFTNYSPVITTASDVRQLNSIDEFAALNNWKIENPENIKLINSAFIEGKAVSCCCSDSIFKLLKEKFPKLIQYKEISSCSEEFVIAVDRKKLKTDKAVLWLKSL